MNDWTTFTKRITVNATFEDIYKAWATKNGIESWFLRSSDFLSSANEPRQADEFAESGGGYLWKWFGWGEDAEQRGTIIEANGIDRFKFTFHDPMVVSVRLLKEQGTPVVELTQTNIPIEDDARKNYFIGCGEGWTFYLANLKSILEGGLDLRNKDENIKNVVNS